MLKMLEPPRLSARPLAERKVLLSLATDADQAKSNKSRMTPCLALNGLFDQGQSGQLARREHIVKKFRVRIARQAGCFPAAEVFSAIALATASSFSISWISLEQLCSTRSKAWRSGAVEGSVVSAMLRAMKLAKGFRSFWIAERPSKNASMAVTPVPPKRIEHHVAFFGISFDVSAHDIGRAAGEIRMHPVMPRVLLPGCGNGFQNRFDVGAIHLTRLCPKSKGQPDDFVQLLFGWAAAKGERAGQVFPIVQRQAIKVAGDKDFQRGSLLHVARVFQ